MRVTAEFLYSIAPGANATIVNAIVAHQSFLDTNRINDPTDIAHFFAQCACETAGFTRIEENLYYTSAKRLMQVWPSRFKSASDALPYVRNPKMLANKVYGGRLGNRPGTNDGYAYRGSGCKQTTGRLNFVVVQYETGVRCVNTPDLLRQFPGAFESACVYWRVHKLSRFAQRGDIEGLTKAIQGGQSGLADRRTYTERALKAIKAPITPQKPQTAQRNDWLRKGSKGTAVEALQKLLQAHGYYDGGKLDGIFGDGMDNAVRDFQRDRGLISDGVIGDKTIKALEASSANAAPRPQDRPTAPKPVDRRVNGLAEFLAAMLEAIVEFLKGLKNGKK